MLHVAPGPRASGEITTPKFLPSVGNLILHVVGEGACYRRPCARLFYRAAARPAACRRAIDRRARPSRPPWSRLCSQLIRQSATQPSACKMKRTPRPREHARLISTGLAAAFGEVTKRYGPRFRTQYGWAAEVWTIERPTLSDIERSVHVDHLRAHYRMASHNVPLTRRECSSN
jgi:hypothetical protein